MLMFFLGMVIGSTASIIIEHKVLPRVKEKVKQMLGN